MLKICHAPKVSHAINSTRRGGEIRQRLVR